MARRKNQPEAVRAKCDLADRLREVRTERFGERGAPELARQLGLPIRTWYNYESGVTLPAEILLRFLELTGVEPLWLLHHHGPKYRECRPQEAAGPASAADLLRKALRLLERDGVPRRDGPSPAAVPGTNGSGPLLNGRTNPSHGGELPDRHADCCVIVSGEAMLPLLAAGSHVVYSDAEEAPAALDGALVVAWVEGHPLVRWFGISGRFAMLRAENPTVEPKVTLWSLTSPQAGHRLRRVLWASTPH